MGCQMKTLEQRQAKAHNAVIYRQKLMKLDIDRKERIACLKSKFSMAFIQERSFKIEKRLEQRYHFNLDIEKMEKELPNGTSRRRFLQRINRLKQKRDTILCDALVEDLQDLDDMKHDDEDVDDVDDIVDEDKSPAVAALVEMQQQVIATIPEPTMITQVNAAIPPEPTMITQMATPPEPTTIVTSVERLQQIIHMQQQQIFQQQILINSLQNALSQQTLLNIRNA